MLRLLFTISPNFSTIITIVKINTGNMKNKQRQAVAKTDGPSYTALQQRGVFLCLVAFYHLAFHHCPKEKPVEQQQYNLPSPNKKANHENPHPHTKKERKKEHSEKDIRNRKTESTLDGGKRSNF